MENSVQGLFCIAEKFFQELLHPFQIKRRCIFLLCAAFLLHKPFGQSQGDGSVQDFVVLITGNAPVDFRIIAAFIKRRVLA